MIDLLTVEKTFIEAHIKEGGTVVDFTMGNGHDTLWLSNKVGENGKVYAFDVQEAALVSSEKLLSESGCPKNYTLILDSHANVENYVKEPICAGMFNLGYLPGSDKTVTTLRESTMAAVQAALRLLDKDGGRLREIHTYSLHNEDETIERSLVVIEKVEQTRPIYPRVFAQISKKPL